MLCLCCCWVRQRALASGVSTLVVSIVYGSSWVCFIVSWCLLMQPDVSVEILTFASSKNERALDPSWLKRTWTWCFLKHWHLNFHFQASGYNIKKTLTWTCESEYLSIPFYFLFSENSHDSWAWVFTRPYSMRSFCPWRSAVKPAIDKLVGWSREGLWSSYQGLVTTSYWSMVGLRSVDPNWGWTDTPKPFGNGLLSKRPTEFRGP